MVFHSDLAQVSFELANSYDVFLLGWKLEAVVEVHDTAFVSHFFETLGKGFEILSHLEIVFVDC